MGPPGTAVPPQLPRTGRSVNDYRTVFDGILWVLRTGSLWRNLPERYGSLQTICGRFHRWPQISVWGRLLTALQAQVAHNGTLDGTPVILRHQKPRSLASLHPLVSQISSIPPRRDQSEPPQCLHGFPP